MTERAAVWRRGCADAGPKAADQAAVDAMRRELNKLPIDGTVVIGEGELDEAPMLFIGEKVGNKEGAEGRHRGRSARRHHAVRQEHARRDRDRGHGGGRHPAQRPGRLHGEDRDRPGYPKGVVDSTRRPSRTSSLAKAKGVKPARNQRAHPRPSAPRRPDRRRA